jgi:hypothetical protein
MKDIKEYEQDLATIRHTMDRSVKFISLSGLSGILAGVYALVGALAAYSLVQFPRSPLQYRVESLQQEEVLWKLLLIASLVLGASLATGAFLSYRKAKRHQEKLFTPASRNLFINLSIPLVTGGLFVLILLYTGHYGVAAPACLIFYGLGLLQASPNLFGEVRYLGYSEIALGLVAALLPGYGLLFWALGFGALHIVYGAIMYNKYDK